MTSDALQPILDRYAKLLEACVSGSWTSDLPIEADACASALLELLPDAIEQWPTFFDRVAKALAAPYRESPDSWHALVEKTALFVDFSLRTSLSQAGRPTAGADKAVAKAMVGTLLELAPHDERTRFLSRLDASEVYQAVVDSLEDGLWAPSEPEVVTLAAKIWEDWRNDLVLNLMLDPLKKWAAREPNIARHIVDQWLDRRPHVMHLSIALVQTFAEGAISGLDGWEAWREEIIRRLVDSRDVDRQGLGVYLANVGWPDMAGVPVEKRHAYMLLVLESATPEAVHFGLQAMLRDVGTYLEQALATCLHLIDRAAELESEDRNGALWTLARILFSGLSELKADGLSSRLEKLLDPLLERLLNSVRLDGWNQLDAMLGRLAKKDSDRATSFFLSWLENPVRLRGKPHRVRRLFPQIVAHIDEAHGSFSAWLLPLMASREPEQRRLAASFLAVEQSDWTLPSLDHLTTQEKEGLCCEIGSHVPQNRSWIGLLVELGLREPGCVALAKEILSTEAVAEWPGECKEQIERWKAPAPSLGDTHRDQLRGAFEEVSARANEMTEVRHDATMACPELRSLRPAEGLWRQEMQRRIGQPHEQSALMQLIPSVPILRGAATVLEEGTATTGFKEVSVSIRLPWRHSVDPLTTLYRQLALRSAATRSLDAEETS